MHHLSGNEPRYNFRQLRFETRKKDGENGAAFGRVIQEIGMRREQALLKA
jgi:hypothetical protein